LLVVEVEAGHRLAGFRFHWLFFNADRPTRRVELHYAIAFWIAHPISEYRCATFPCSCSLELLRKSVPKEQIITEDETGGASSQEAGSDGERLCESLRLRLNRIFNAYAPLVAISKQLLEGLPIARGGNHQDVTDTSQHQCRKRIVDQRLIVDGQELLRHDESHRV